MNSGPKTPGVGASVGKDDNALAAELKAGNADALTHLFDKYRGVVFRISHRILADEGEAEETTQQVFIEVYKRIDKFDSQAGPFKVWLFKKAAFRAVDRKRRLQAQRVCDWVPVEDDTSGEIPEKSIFGLTRQEIVHLVHDLLRILSPREQKVISLRYLKGLTLQEVEVEANETAPSVRHLIYRGLKKMQLALLREEQTKTQNATNVGSKSQLDNTAPIL